VDSVTSSLTPLLTPQDVAERLGVTYEGAELVQVERLCADVSALVRSRRPDIDQWLGSGELNFDIVIAVCVQVVARALTSITTGGVGVRSEEHPEYSYELTSSTASGLNLTNRELQSLTPPDRRNRPFSVTPSPCHADCNC
jgi:hypothetical protein